MRAFLCAVALAALALLAPAKAHAGSTVNPAIPGTNSPLVSAPIRGNFAATFNDINNILTKFSGVTAPASPSCYQDWADTSLLGSTSVVTFKFWNCATSVWIAWGQLNTATNVWTPIGTLGVGIIGSLPITVTPSGGNQVIGFSPNRITGPMSLGTTTPGGLAPDFVPCNDKCFDVSNGTTYSLLMHGDQETYYALGLGAGYAWFEVPGPTSRGPSYAWTLNGEGDNALHLITSFNSFCITASPNCPEGAIASSPMVLTPFWTYFAVNVGPGPNSGNPLSSKVDPGANSASFTGSISGNTLTASSVTGAIRNGALVNGSGVNLGVYVVKQLTGTSTATFNGAIANPSSIPTLTVTGISGTLHLGDFITGGGVAPYTQIVGFGTGVGGNGTYGISSQPFVCSPSGSPSPACQTIGSPAAMSSFVPGGAGTYQVSLSPTPVGPVAMTATFSIYNAGAALGWNYRGLGETNIVCDTNAHTPANLYSCLFSDWNDATNTMTDLVGFNSPTNPVAPGAINPFFGTAGVTNNSAAAPGTVGEYKTSRCNGFINGSATITIASPAVVTFTHPFVSSGGRQDACPIRFTTTGSLPTGIVAGTNYYVIPSTISGNNFSIATTLANALAGTAINTSGTQSGTHTAFANAICNIGIGVTAIALPAGNWQVSGANEYQSDTPTSTNVNLIAGALSTTETLIDQSQTIGFEEVPGYGLQFFNFANLPTTKAGPLNALLNSTTNYYLNGYVGFSGAGSTCKNWGQIQAWRIR